MNRKMISFALANVDDNFILETMYAPGMKTDRAPERTIHMNNRASNKTRIRTRQLLRLAMAACLVFALAVTAYAFNFLGIREMLQKSGEELPEEAIGYIQEQDMSIDSKVWRTEVTESLCDADNIYITISVTASGEYILAPTDAMPEHNISVIGLVGDQTLGEYAAEHGKKLLCVGAGIQEREKLGIGSTSQSFENTSEQEMTILLKAKKSPDVSVQELVCIVTAVEDTAVRSHHMGVSLVEAPSKGSGLYVPDNANPFPGMTIGNVTVSESPLGFSIRFMTSVESQDIFDDIKKVEFDGIVRGEGGGWVLEDDGNWWHTISRCTGEVGDTLVARYYDWDDQLIATITFTKS